MADFNEETIRRLEAEFNRGQMSASQFATALSALNAQIARSKQQAGDLAGALNRAAQGSRSQGAAAAALAADLKRAAQSARASSATSEEARRKYEEQVSHLVSQIGDRELRANIKRFSEGAYNAAGSAEAFNRVLAFASKPMNSLGSVFSSYQAGSSQIGTASTVLREGASLAGSSLSALGKTMQEAALGMGLLAKSIPGRIIATGLGALGMAADAAGRALKLAAEKVLPALQAEIEKNIGAFQALSSAGATYSEGLQSMINASGLAGLTLDQFAKIVVTNKEILAGSGLGVSEASNLMARSIRSGGDEAKKRLLNLGYTIEEQAGLYAETMKRMTQSGERFRSGDPNATAMVAEQTQKYAENLRIIAQITGEDAKAKMAEAQAAANELAFQQKLAGMDAKQRDEIIQSMSAMSPLMKKAYQETVVFGQAITPGVAAAVGQSEAMQQALQETVALHESGLLTTRRQLDINAKYGDSIKDDLLGNEAIARAGMAGVGGIVGEIKAAMQDELQYRIKWNRDAIQGAIDRTLKQSEPEKMPEGEGALQSKMTDLILNNQKLNVQIQNTVLTVGVLDGYLQAANFAVREFTDALSAFTNLWPQFARTTELNTIRRDQIQLGQPLTPQQVPDQIRLRERELELLQQDPNRGRGGDIDRRINYLEQQNDSLRQTGQLNPNVTVPRNLIRTPTQQRPAQQPAVPAQPPSIPSGGPQQPNQPTPGPQTNARPASTALPAAAMTTENLYRQARALYGAPTQQEQAEQIQQQALSRQSIDDQDERESQSSRMAQQRSIEDRERVARVNNDSRVLEQLASTMDAVRNSMEDSLRHLSRIEDYTRQTATG